MNGANPSAGTAAAQAAVVIERSYRASVEELWALWTTKAGFESWWGPEGFRVEVHALEARAGGTLEYDMIADAPEAIAAMQSMGQPLSHATRGRFAEFRPHERLALVHVIDFIAGVEPYDSRIEVDFSRPATRRGWWSRSIPTSTRTGPGCRSRASAASSASSTGGSAGRGGSGCSAPARRPRF